MAHVPAALFRIQIDLSKSLQWGRAECLLRVTLVQLGAANANVTDTVSQSGPVHYAVEALQGNSMFCGIWIPSMKAAGLQYHMANIGMDNLLLK